MIYPHGRIKPNNLFVDFDEKGIPMIKISDVMINEIINRIIYDQKCPILFNEHVKDETIKYLPQNHDFTGYFNNIVIEEDIFSVFASFYEILTNHELRSIENKNNCYHIKYGSIIPISKLNPQIPNNLASLFDKVLYDEHFPCFDTNDVIKELQKILKV